MMARLRVALSRENLGRSVFLVATCIHLVAYWLVGFALMVNLTFPKGSYLIDFYSNFMEGVEKYLENPVTLYQEADISGEKIWVFRNLPLSIFFYLPFHFIPSAGNQNLIAFSLVILVANLLNTYFIFKIYQLDDFKRRSNEGGLFSRPWVAAAMFMLPILHVSEYYLGQSNALAGLFVTIGMYQELKGNRDLAVLSWSFSMNFKITTMFLLFLVIERDAVTTARHIYHAIIPQIPNIVLFLAFPNWITDFVDINIRAGSDLTTTGYKGWGTGSSGTLSVFLSQAFGIPILPATVVPMATFLPLTLFLMARAGEKLGRVDRVMMLFCLVAVLVPIFWGVHALFYLATLACWHGQRTSSIIDRNVKVLMTIPSVSFFIWMVFPFNFLWFLLPLILVDYRLLVDRKGRKDARMAVKT